MTRRKKLFNTLKNVLIYVLDSNVVIITIWILFSIVGGIVGFLTYNKEPILLTEKEVEYYTTQAEIGYLEGSYYLDDDVEFIHVNDTTFNVYSSNEPNQKQKLRVTFSNNTVSKTEVYYSIDFLDEKLQRTALGFALVFFAFDFLLLFRRSIYQKIENTSYDCPLNFDKNE